MNYNDLARPSIRQQHPDMLEQLQKGDLVLPAVYIDGNLVSLGYIDYFSISKAVENARKAAVRPGPKTED